MLSSIVAILFLGERPGVLGILGIIAIGIGIFFLTGGLRRNAHPKNRAAIIAGLLTGASIATYTVWDKYAVSVVHVSPILQDLLANPVQALFLTPLVWNRRTEISTYWRRNRPELFGVTILNPISYILILMAMTVAPVSQIAPVREVSTFFLVLLSEVGSLASNTSAAGSRPLPLSSSASLPLLMGNLIRWLVYGKSLAENDLFGH
jgi:drug/metabolite transporter (DMT)-like permease